jgi:histidinol-phosphatase
MAISTFSLEEDLKLALELADEADRITTDWLKQTDLQVESKPDMTPVTAADKAVETMVRERLAKTRPQDGMFGEEFGGTAQADRRWIVDPIDGTKNYARHNPVFATLIGLQQGDNTVVGVVSAPELGRRWWATRGRGAFRNGQQIHVSKVKKLSDAFMSYASLHPWRSLGKQDAVVAFEAACGRGRAFGDFWMHMLVAEGALDVALEPTVKIWDIAPLLVIVEEAGGTITDLKGHRGLESGNAISTNGLLHAESLKLLASLGAVD